MINKTPIIATLAGFTLSSVCFADEESIIIIPTQEVGNPILSNFIV